MNFLTWLARISARIPESRAKTFLRHMGYRFMSNVSFGSELISYRGISFRMIRHPLLGGTGCELTALDGYVGLFDISPGYTVVDCGAYSGDFTLYAAIRVGSTGRVLAFEPDVTGYRMLMRNLRLNGIANTADGHHAVDFIKMDIEGAEIEALEGMRNTFTTVGIRPKGE